MRIGILGSGAMGSALGTVWAQAGHHVFFSYSRDFGKLEDLAKRIGQQAQAATVTDAVAQSEALLIAIPWHRLDDLLKQAGSLQDKILLTCMLPMTEDDSDLALGFTTSGAEELGRRTEARVVGTFNTVWSNVIATRPAHSNSKGSMFYIGDDSEAKQIAEQLIRDAGFDPIDAGLLANARLLEPFGLLMGRMGFAYDPLVAYRFVKP